MSQPFHVYRVNLPEGLTDVVSYLPEDIVFNSGLAGEAMIATHAPELPELQAEARRQHSGWVYVIDARTPTPAGDVPPWDILGRFEGRDGAIVPRSYQPNPNHTLCSSNGLFQLDSRLYKQLLERVMTSASGSS
ncbi:MAG TPA: hypothetical protein VJN96_09860 [Vicinamibacterales bacterium]|nr:hypothetical protein [Vicinamibacterales bacterium]